jgi:hypothetical protein
MEMRFFFLLLATIAHFGGVTAQTLAQTPCVTPAQPGPKGSSIGALKSTEVVGVVPPYNSQRFGYFHFTLDAATGDLDLTISAKGLTGNVTSVTMNCDTTGASYSCLQGATCPVCLDIMQIAKEQTDKEGFPMKLSITMKQELAMQLRSGSAYFQVTTDAYPGGELRGYGLNYTESLGTGCANYLQIQIAATSESPAVCKELCTADPNCATYSVGTGVSPACYRFTAGCVSNNAVPAYNTYSKMDPYMTSAPTWMGRFEDGDGVFFMYTGSNSSEASAFLIHNVMANDTNVTFGYDTERFNASGIASPGQINMTFPAANEFGPGAGGPEVLLQSNLSAYDVEMLHKLQAVMRIHSVYANRSIWTRVMPTDISPVKLEDLGNNDFDVAVFPPNKRGYDGASVTVSINFPTAALGNEIWVTFPEEFGFNSMGMTGIKYPVGIPMPDTIMVSEEEHQVQLRWNNSVPLLTDTYLVSFTVTHVALPNNCDEEEYKIKTAQCYLDDFMNAGVLHYRKCTPASTDLEMEAEPDNGVPKGCRKDGCDACKYLYTSPVDNGMVYSCEHQGQTFYRVNVSFCEPCTYAATYEK